MLIHSSYSALKMYITVSVGQYGTEICKFIGKNMEIFKKIQLEFQTVLPYKEHLCISDSRKYAGDHLNSLFSWRSPQLTDKLAVCRSPKQGAHLQVPAVSV